MRKERTYMKIFRMLGRNIRNAFKSVFRNFSLSLASISCITITLIIVAISILATLNVNNFAKVMKEDVTMVVFLNTETTAEEEEQIEFQLKNMDNVESVEFRSKEDVKNEMAGTSETLRSIMEEWEESDNPLKDNYLIKVTDIEKIKDTANEIQKIEQVDAVNYGEGMIEQLITAYDAVQKVSLLVVIALIVVTIFLIINTIKLTIFSRKREISIMRLVGASNFTIKNPFVIEGMFLGILGSIIPILITTYGYLAFYNHFQGYLFSSPLIKLIKPEPFIYYVALLVLVIGIIVGMLGSYRAVKKYLKV